MTRRGLGGLTGLTGLALLLGGCSALLGGPFSDEMPSSSPIAAYRTGTATIAIEGGETIELTKLSADSGVNSLFGSDVRWTGPSGWHLRISGAGGDAGMMGPGSGYLTFDRIVDGEHWTTAFNESRCILDVDVVDAKAIRGSATCKGVAWYDALDQMFVEGGPDKLDEPEFDAEITFEAVP